MHIIFESHATSVDNERGIASGHNDSPLLSTKGFLQAQELGRRYETKPIKNVFCSDLRRSRDTAHIAFAGKGIKIFEDQRLREWNYGLHNGAEVARVEKEKKSHIYTPFPGGESLLMALDRIYDFLEQQRVDTQDPFLIIGHRVVFYALEHLLDMRSLEEIVAGPWCWQPGWEYHF